MASDRPVRPRPLWTSSHSSSTSWPDKYARDFRQIIRRRHVDTALALSRFDQKKSLYGG
jgi:hypothetical protein